MKELTALEAAKSLLEDVDFLLEHHPAQQDPKPGKPAGPNQGPLLRASTSLCYTAWEVYVEDSLIETVEWLLENKGPGELPQDLLKWVTKRSSDPWDFVEDSWKSVVRRLVKSRIERFNTASPDKVSELYKDIIGFEPLKYISWQKKDNRSVRKEIAELVRLRGEIVHRGSTPGPLTLSDVRKWSDFVRRLTERFNERMVEFRSNV